MEQKKVLITGANKGIGYEIANRLLKAGFYVIITGRDEQRLSDAFSKLKGESSSIHMILMDVSDEMSVQKTLMILSQDKLMLDVLINNAAISYNEDRSLLSEDFNSIEDIINTNSYGPLRVIRAFLPVMNRPGRIINISSSGGSMSEPVGGWSPAYCVSKTMLNAITRHLAYELKETKIAVNAVCPRCVRTEMGGRSAPLSVEQGAETPVWLATIAPIELTGFFVRNKKIIDW